MDVKDKAAPELFALISLILHETLVSFIFHYPYDLYEETIT